MTFTHELIRALEQEPALAQMVSKPPISFHRSFVDITGSPVAALMLSSYLDVQEKLPPQSNGWFTYDPHSIKDLTGISRNDQKAANKLLRDLKLTMERRNIISKQWEFKLDFERITVALIEIARRYMNAPHKDSSDHPSS